MKKLVLSLGLGLVLVGCGESEVSVDYYYHNLSEAKVKVAECKKANDNSVNCKNAQEAIDITDDNFDRMMGVGKYEVDFGAVVNEAMKQMNKEKQENE